MPGSVSVGVTHCIQYAACQRPVRCATYTSARPGATNFQATPPIPVEAVARNQYHCPGSSSCWDVSGDAAGGRLTCPALGEEGWRGRRLKSVRVVVRGEIGGVVPRTENDPVSDSFNLLGRRAALVETTVEHRRGVCVCLCVSVCMPPHLLVTTRSVSSCCPLTRRDRPGATSHRLQFYKWPPLPEHASTASAILYRSP